MLLRKRGEKDIIRLKRKGGRLTQKKRLARLLFFKVSNEVKDLPSREKDLIQKKWGKEKRGPLSPKPEKSYASISSEKNARHQPVRIKKEKKGNV